MSIDKTIEQKLNVKPIYFHLVHNYSYEGPCRTGKGDQLTPEYDEKYGLENFERLKEDLKHLYSDDVKLLEPLYITWKDDFILKDEHLSVVEADLQETDIFLVSGQLSQYYGSELALKYKKPVGVVGCCVSVDTSAYLNSVGLEGYAYIDHHHADPHFSLLRARKGIARTRVLSVLKGDMVSKGVVSGIRNLDSLTQKYGIKFKFVNAEEVLDAVSELDEKGLQEAERIADELIGKAVFCDMKREFVVNSAKYYVVVKRLLERFECNAFTSPCFEICATRRLNKEKYTFCLAHTLLKEDGIPSSCEADMNALLAMDILMNLTNAAPHMGNLHPVEHGRKPEKFKDVDNLLSMHHAVPTRYMHGRGGEPTPYGIQCFTHSGWGATIRHNYDEDEGKTVTFVRVDPTGTRLLAVRATIVGDIGFRDIGCATGFYSQVADVKDFFKKESQFGHHFAWVYGDVTESLIELGELMGIEVVTA